MDSGAFPLTSKYPVAIVGAGPVGLTTALALAYYKIPFVIFEANPGLSTETKAGTTFIRTLEMWQRFGAAEDILRKRCGSTRSATSSAPLTAAATP